MAEAQFMPAQSDPAGQFFRAADASQSFMQRRQRMQWEAEDREQQKRQRQMAEPLVQLKMRADQASALATLDTFKQQQELRRRFAEEAPLANKEFHDALRLPTYEDQEKALAQIQPKYGWMELLPEGKPFVDTLNNSRAQAFQYSLADKKIKAEMDAVNQRGALQMEAIKRRGEEQRMTDQAYGKGLSNEQRLMRAYDDAVQNGDEEEKAFYAARIERLKRQTSALTDEEKIIGLRKKADEIELLDPEGAKMLRSRAEYFSNPNAAVDLLNTIPEAGGNPEGGAAPKTPSEPQPVPTQKTGNPVIDQKSLDDLFKDVTY